jgi:[protein-PII] uridylyltransferase
VRVVAADRTGLLADAAAMLALERASVRSARAWTGGAGADAVAFSEWAVAASGLDAAGLRRRLEAVVAGRVDPAARLGPPPGGGLAARVVARPEASDRATVLEVRATDRPGLVHTVCRALADLGVGVRSAHVSTLGPQAVDVFYVHDADGRPLGDAEVVAAVAGVRAALVGSTGD